MKHLFSLFAILVFISCQETEQSGTYLNGNAFGTEYHIKYYEQEDYGMQIDSIVEKVNQSVSTYLPTSDISKVNEGDSTIVVDAIFVRVLKLSQRIHEESEGYFDPTVGVLRNAYGFGDDEPVKKIDGKVLDSLRLLVGFSNIRLTEENQIRKDNRNIYLDFNAIAKGYGIDLIGEFLEQKGIENYLIELGGEIRTKGKNTEKNKSWMVGVEGIDSELEDRSYTHALKLKNQSLASSGNYRKFRIDSLNGNKYVHTINPLNGKAEQTNITSTSVIAKTCAEADAYATTIMAMGHEKTIAFLKRVKDIEVYYTYLDEQNKAKEFMTEGFKEQLTD
ncbi:FAD:protein FMN transferase [Mesonia ostreae]|uniref:FAD:protein FMN transferase n=1 Tax=Mesonia ostreae TaxID=861110 RepID=A0ABU2KF09_9FLAO|nr:FAD:protein FMN transferase [Mesonia ostreae]MDT0293283.1 FAD:protein FMN transferase [Mesonia ostreae]